MLFVMLMTVAKPMLPTEAEPEQMKGIMGKQAKEIQNNARLKELMTARPMTAERHAAINRKRIRARRMLEDAKELKSSKDELF
jgi:hypothetical protein